VISVRYPKPTTVTPRCRYFWQRYGAHL